MPLSWLCETSQKREQGYVFADSHFSPRNVLFDRVTNNCIPWRCADLGRPQEEGIGRVAGRLAKRCSPAVINHEGPSMLWWSDQPGA